MKRRVFKFTIDEPIRFEAAELCLHLAIRHAIPDLDAVDPGEFSYYCEPPVILVRHGCGEVGAAVVSDLAGALVERGIGFRFVELVEAKQGAPRC